MLQRARRPLRLVWGYVGACIFMAFALACAAAWTMPGVAVPEVFVMTAWLTRLVFIVGILPSVIAIAIFEWRSVRRWSAYVIFGALFSAIAAIIISGGLENPKAVDLATVAIDFALLGAASATIYWWIAGRFAGRGAIAQD